MWEREYVLPYAVKIQDIADRIEDAHWLNNSGQEDYTSKRNLLRDFI